MRVLITQPAQEAEASVRALAARGHEPIAIPLVTLERESSPEINLAGAQAFLAASPEAVRSLSAHVGVRTFPIFVDSELTAAEARRAGFKEVLAARDDSQDLARLVERSLKPSNGALIYACSTGAPVNLPAMLGNMGFAVRALPLYSIKRVAEIPRLLRDKLDGNAIDAALFLSPDEARAFVSLLQRDERPPSIAALKTVAATPAIAAPLRALKGASVTVAPATDPESVWATLDGDLVDKVETERVERERRAREEEELKRAEEARRRREEEESARLARERAEAERIAHERLLAEREAAAKAAAEEAELARLAREEERRIRAEEERRRGEDETRARAEKSAREAAEREKREKERAAREESDRIQREKDREERERLQAEETLRAKAEKIRLAAEKAAREEAERERARAAREERERAKAEEAARQEVEKTRQAAERAEHERVRKEKEERARAERIEQDRLRAERFARERAEKERLAAERAAHEKAEREQHAREKAARDEAERARLAAERAIWEEAERARRAAEHAAWLRQEAARIAQETAAREERERKWQEEARRARDEAERKRSENERLTLAREKERYERERIAREETEQRRAAAERLARQEAEAARAEEERRAEAARLEAEQRSLAAQAEREKQAEKARRETERLAAARMERERAEAEQASREAESARIAREEASAQRQREEQARREERERRKAEAERRSQEEAEARRLAREAAASAEAERRRIKAEKRAEAARLKAERPPAPGWAARLAAWAGGARRSAPFPAARPRWAMVVGDDPPATPTSAAVASAASSWNDTPMTDPQRESFETTEAAPPSAPSPAGDERPTEGVPSALVELSELVERESSSHRPPETAAGVEESLADAKPAPRSGGGRSAQMQAEDAADDRARDRLKNWGRGDLPREDEATADPEPEIAAAPVRRARGAGRSVALFLVLASIATLALMTNERWLPLLFGEPESRVASAPVAPSAPRAPPAERAAAPAQVAAAPAPATSAASSPPAADAAANQTIAALMARIATLEAALGNTVALAEIDRRVDALESSRAEANSVLALADRVSLLEQAGRSAADARAGAVALTIAATQWRDAVAMGRPFLKEWDTVKALSGETANGAAFAKYATTGFPPFAEIRARFDAAAAAAVRASYLPDDTAPWLRRVMDRVFAVVTIRRTDRDVGDGLDAILVRADRALTSGELAAASRELRKLTGAPLAAAMPWIELAEARNAAELAAQEIVIGAASAIAAPDKPPASKAE